MTSLSALYDVEVWSRCALEVCSRCFTGLGRPFGAQLTAVIGWYTQHSVLESWVQVIACGLLFQKKRTKSFQEQSTEAHGYRSLPEVSTPKYSLSLGRSPDSENRLNLRNFFYFVLPSKTTLHRKRPLSGYFPVTWHMKNYSQDLQLTVVLIFVVKII